MLKAFEELEKAVGRILERDEGRKKTARIPGDRTPPVAGAQNDEAAELIRRAIKRLKSL